jgi:hypothetical protein
VRILEKPMNISKFSEGSAGEKKQVWDRDLSAKFPVDRKENGYLLRKKEC